MRAQRILALVTLILTACPVEHAADDSAPPVRRDAGDGDAAELDAATADLRGTDVIGVDLARPDTASVDRASGHDASRPDSAAVDRAAADTSLADLASHPDSSGGDSTAPICTSDDAMEPNDTAGEAKPLDLTQTYTLTGCDDDWFSFTLPANKTLVVDALFSDALADLDLKLYRPGNLSSSIASAMSLSDNEQLRLAAQGVATPLLLLVDHFSGGSAPYTLQFTLSDPPANSSCESAQVVSVPANGSIVRLFGDTTSAGANRSSTISGCQGSTGSEAPDLFYRFTASAGMTGNVFVQNVNQTDWYSVIYAFEGSCAASSDLACSSQMLTIATQPGQTYYIVVDGELRGDSGPFELALWYSPIPDNDTCQGAEAIPLLADGTVATLYGNSAEGTNTMQAQSNSLYCRKAVSYAPELFYQFTAPIGGTVQFELDAQWDASLYVQDGGCGASPTELLCWGHYRTSMEHLWHRMEVEAGHAYTVVVDGYGDICCSDSQGPFVLRARYVLDPPLLQGGESCANAVALPSRSGTIRGDTSGTTSDVNPNDVGCDRSGTGGDLFYRLTVPAGETATLRVEHTVQYFPLLMYLLRGECTLRADSCLIDGQGEPLLVVVDDAPLGELSVTNAGATSVDYFVVIDATSSSYGEEFDLTWSVAP